MRADSPRWHEISPSQFGHEREGLAHLRELLPDRAPFQAWTNFEFLDRHGKWHEVDALVLGERRLHLIELKHGPPEFTVLAGRNELGRIDPSLLTEEVPGDRLLLLGGRSWRVTYIDWRRQRCFVEVADGFGRARWLSRGLAGLSHELTRAMREVLLGTDPPVSLTRRATERLVAERERRLAQVHPGGNVIVRDRQDDVRWWTWAGFRANATLAATLSELVDPIQRFDDCQLRLRSDLTPALWRDGTVDAQRRLCLPDVSEKALDGLKFSDALPKRLAIATLAARLANLNAAKAVLNESTRFASS